MSQIIDNSKLRSQVTKSLWEWTRRMAREIRTGLANLTLYVISVQNRVMLHIDFALRTPVYEQIANGLRAELVSRRFRPGEKLPTVRALAIDLGVHHNTVAEAYRQLANEGWLELRRHRGAVVRERPRPRAKRNAMDGFVRPLRELVARALADGLPSNALVEEMVESARKLEEGAF